MVCIQNRNGKPHIKQENRKARRQRRALRRAEEAATWTPAERDAWQETCRQAYLDNKGL